MEGNDILVKINVLSFESYQHKWSMYLGEEQYKGCSSVNVAVNPP